jgi:hypothetical protein
VFLGGVIRKLELEFYAYCYYDMFVMLNNYTTFFLSIIIVLFFIINSCS